MHVITSQLFSYSTHRFQSTTICSTIELSSTYCGRFLHSTTTRLSVSHIELCFLYHQDRDCYGIVLANHCMEIYGVQFSAFQLPVIQTCRFFNNLLFNLCCACVAKIFSDLDEISPLGVIFCVDHESDIIFSIRDRDQG